VAGGHDPAGHQSIRRYKTPGESGGV